MKNNEGKNWGPFIAHVPRFFTPVAIRTFMISFKLHGPLFDWKYYFGKLTVGETKEGKERGIRVFFFQIEREIFRYRRRYMVIYFIPLLKK